MGMRIVDSAHAKCNRSRDDRQYSPTIERLADVDGLFAEPRVLGRFLAQLAA